MRCSFAGSLLQVCEEDRERKNRQFFFPSSIRSTIKGYRAGHTSPAGQQCMSVCCVYLTKTTTQTCAVQQVEKHKRINRLYLKKQKRTLASVYLFTFIFFLFSESDILFFLPVANVRIIIFLVFAIDYDSNERAFKQTNKR